MGRSSRVLFVDDDRDTVLTCCMLLQREGCQVRGVHTAQDALVALPAGFASQVRVD